MLSYVHMVRWGGTLGWYAGMVRWDGTLGWYAGVVRWDGTLGSPLKVSFWADFISMINYNDPIYMCESLTKNY